MAFLKTVTVEGSYGKTKEVKRLDKGAYVTGGVVLAVLFFLLFCFRTVGAGQVGIVLRFGEVNRTVRSGIALKLPWPIEKIVKMETRVQKEEQQSAAATKDLQDVNATLAVNYALDSETAIGVYKQIGVDYKDRIIVPAVQESFKAASATYTATELVTERNAVKAKAYDVIKSRLEQYGIRVVDLNIVNFSFSEEFNKSIEAKQVAAQNAEKAKQDLLRIEVEAQQTITRAEAEARAQRLQRTTITDQLIRYKQLEIQSQAIKQWDGHMPQYFGGSGNILSIPLTK